WFYLLLHRKDLIIVSTPKASLLGSMAAVLSLHRNIIFIVRGCAFENFTGIKLKAFHFLERLVCTLSSKVQFISKELMDRYIELGLCSSKKAFIVGGGSSKGVDLERFSLSRFPHDHKKKVREECNIPSHVFLWICCARIRRDKGIN